MAGNIIDAMLGGNQPLQTLTPDSVKRRRLLAELQMREGGDTSPVQHWSQGANRVLQGLLGGYASGQADRQEAAGLEKSGQLMAALYGGGGAEAPQPSPEANYQPGAVTGAPMDGIEAYAASTRGVESGSAKGNYQAIGPTHPKMGRALGAYQVMESNVGPWSKEILGREVTPDEFLASPEIQDAIFKGKFGQSVQKYGNPQDAASVWFTGRPQAQGANAQDSLGTTGAGYVSKFNAGLGGQPQGFQGGGEAPQPQASAGGDRRMATIQAVLSDPWASPENKQMAMLMYKREQEANDPAAKLDMDYKRAQIAKLAEGSGPASPWKRLDDTHLYNEQDATVRDIGATGGPKPAFAGNSVDAQALSGLVASGRLTLEQAQQIAAGKSITGPNGELIFATPEALIGANRQQGGATPAQGGSPAVVAPPPVAGPQPGMVHLTAPKASESEKNAMTFADRMTTSGSIIDEMGTKGSGRFDQMAGAVPYGLGSIATSDDFKKVDQAKRDFINANLRRESGASIGAAEFENADKQYFPQPGDPPALIEQKKSNRQTVIDGMIRDAGPTYKGQAKKQVVKRYNPQTGQFDEVAQ